MGRTCKVRVPGGVGGGMEGLQGLKICQKGWGYQTDGVKDFNLSSVAWEPTTNLESRKSFQVDLLSDFLAF